MALTSASNADQITVDAEDYYEQRAKIARLEHENEELHETVRYLEYTIAQQGQGNAHAAGVGIASPLGVPSKLGSEGTACPALAHRVLLMRCTCPLSRAHTLRF